MGRLYELAIYIWICVTVLHGDSCDADDETDPFLQGVFPNDFLWAVSTASYQIEGAWNADGKGANIWDTFTHASKNGSNVANDATGDIACDAYNRSHVVEDVQLMKELGITHYRFSLSWSRLLPTGEADKINKDGVEYYHFLLDELKKADIKPMVTLYHWDLPQALEDKGGWANTNRFMVEKFNDYANFSFATFGEKVKLWLTFNEPFVSCWDGYGHGFHAPGRSGLQYEAAHSVLLSHAEAWHTYNDNYRSSQKGRISITLDSDWKQANNSASEADTKAARRAMMFKIGWFANPIFLGDYPQLMKEQVANHSTGESRLPKFTEEQIKRIKGTHDFFGLNHYTTQLIADHKCKPEEEPSYVCDQDAMEIRDPAWIQSGSVWLKVVPWGLRKLLRFIKAEYNDPEIIITENGVSDRSGTLEDDHRIDFYKSYINNALKAMLKDKVNLKGYTAWSLLDNFEWAMGYTEKFGLHFVDFSDPARPRKKKKSATWYKNLIQNKGWPKSSANSLPNFSAFSGVTLSLITSAILCNLRRDQS